MNSRKVFVVHGHDTSSMFELKDFLVSLELTPVLLFQQDDLGMTIIEKFEHYAADCVFAFVLLTPDDQPAAALEGVGKWRARQNVVLELGWFMAKVGRGGVTVLHRGDVELPSDLLGVLYLPFKISIYEVSERIRQRLSGQGLI